MLRSLLSMFLGLGIALISRSVPGTNGAEEPVKKDPKSDAIGKLIEELGSNRFAVRDKAKKRLWEAGSAAEPLLEAAAKNPDEEIANSAKSILEKFQWGLYPDTPKEVVEKIDLFRTGTAEQRQSALGELMRFKPVPFPTLRKLVAKEEDPQLREQMFQQLAVQIREAIPNLLARGDYDAVEQLFELILSGSPTASAADFAAFIYLRHKLDATIARFEKERKIKGEKGGRAVEVLVYLYRIKGDWVAALKAAEETKKDELVELVLWQSGNWKALASASPKPGRSNVAGMVAAYDRLSGDNKAFNEKIDEILKRAEDSMDDRIGIRADADALLLNGRANDAIKMLAEKKKEMALTFDLLCTQMKHKEAFALVDEARQKGPVPEDPQEIETRRVERQEIEIRRARMLYLLGEKDSALNLFEKLTLELKDRSQMTLALSLIKTEARVGLREKALEHAAKYIDTLSKAQPFDSAYVQLLEPMFGDNNKNALGWFLLMRQELPKEDATVAMNRVRDLMGGKLDKIKLDEWVGKMIKNPQANLDQGLPRGRGTFQMRHDNLDGIAAAYRAIGDEAKTAEYLKKAAEKAPTWTRWIACGDFEMGRKKYKEAADSYAKASKGSALPAEADIENEVDIDFFIPTENHSPALPTYLQGRALSLAGDAKEGKRLIELAHWLPLGNEKMRAKLFEELGKRDWPEMARREADMLMKTGWYTDYSYGNILSFLARQAAKDKEFSKAADYFEKCVVGCMRTGAYFVEPSAYLTIPELVRVYRTRGLFAQGKIEAGLKEAMANLEVMPGNIDLAIKLVPDLDKLGKKKEADAIYERVRDAFVKLSKDYPNSAYAHNSTAWVMANCRRDLDDALKHAARTVELEPKSAGYIDTLAEVNFRKGNREKAVSLMKQCVELDPKNKYFKKQLARFKDQPFDSTTPDETGEEED